MLSSSAMKWICKQYVDNRPEGSDVATDPRYGRYHEAGVPFHRGTSTSDTNVYGDHIPSTSEYFLSHDLTPTRTNDLYAYAQHRWEADRRVSYESEEYPWIDTVMIYNNVDNQPYENDIVGLTINGTYGSGHYVAWWTWGGYYDCVDVEYVSIIP